MADGNGRDGMRVTGLPLEAGERARAGAGAGGRGAVTWRSVGLGTIAVVLVCGLAPFNDYVVANSYLVGSYLPLIVVVWLFALTVLVNGPLHRWAPRWALSAGEMAVVLAMMLVACSIPGTGMMRFLLPTLVAPFRFGVVNPQFWNAFLAMDLPPWLFPVESMRDGRSSEIVRGFYDRLQEGPVPYGAWVVPLAGWGVFVGAMVTALVALAMLVRHQWAVNERLAFPLAQLQVSLIEPPRKGRMLNDLLGSRVFWIGLIAVFCLHSMTALQQYFPRVVPAIPLRFNLTSVLSNEPWVYLHGSVKSAAIYFTFIGIAYFIQARISFSLWALFLLAQCVNVQQRMMQSEITAAAWRDQHLGAAVMMVVGILWIGRHRWVSILRQMVGIDRNREGDFASYRLTGWVLVGSLGVMAGWLVFVGVQVWMAVLIIGFILLAHLVTSRVVAETGLPFVRMDASVMQINANLSPATLRGEDVFFSGAFTANGILPTRESVMCFGLHGMQATATATATEGAVGNTRRRSVLVLMGWALALGFAVSVVSSLWCYYRYATPMTPQIQTVINPVGLEDRPRVDVVDPLARWSTGYQVRPAHNAWMHMGIGATITGFLQFASWRWVAWPLAPVGYVLASSWYLQVAWFSLMLGWGAKVVILKYGGPKLLQAARPLFVGIIFGEAVAAGVWLIVTLVLAGLGVDYRAITLLPT